VRDIGWAEDGTKEQRSISRLNGKPTVVIAGAMQKPWTYNVLPEPELRLLYAAAMATRRVYYSVTPTMLDQPQLGAVRVLGRLHRPVFARAASD
jgi:hypothetical protein